MAGMKLLPSLPQASNPSIHPWIFHSLSIPSGTPHASALALSTPFCSSKGEESIGMCSPGLHPSGVRCGSDQADWDKPHPPPAVFPLALPHGFGAASSLFKPPKNRLPSESLVPCSRITIKLLFPRQLCCFFPPGSIQRDLEVSGVWKSLAGAQVAPQRRKEGGLGKPMAVGWSQIHIPGGHWWILGIGKGAERREMGWDVGWEPGVTGHQGTGG